MSPRVAVIVLAYNGVDLTLNCLASLRQSDYAHAEVIVVDNASTVDSMMAIRAAFPETAVPEIGRNLG
jgi:GT2 family glycosyltransferase